MEKLVKVFLAALLFSVAAFGQIDPGSKGHGQPTFDCAINETYGDLDTGLVWKCYTPPTGWAPTPYFQPWGTVSTGGASLIDPDSQAFTGPITAPVTNLDFYVAGTPSSCPGGFTSLDCAWIAASAYGTANNTSPIIHLAPGINRTCTGLATSSSWRPSLIGNGMYGSVIQQMCSISTPTVSYGCEVGTNDANPTHIERVTIDANNLAPQALSYFAHNLSFIEHVVLRGANGTNNFGQFGSTSCPGGTVGSTFQISVNDLYVDGKGTGPNSWAAGTVNISAGVPSVTVTTPGHYNHQNPPGYLVGYGAGANPCTVMGTVTVNTLSAGSQFTVSSVNLSGFSGCVVGAGAYIYIPDLPPAQFGVDFQVFTDAVSTMVVTNTVGVQASIRNENSANTFVGAHPYNAYVGIKDDAGANWYGVDCDSNQIMFLLGAPTRIHGCNVFYNSHTVFPGASVYLFGSGSNGSTLEGTNAINGSENADYHEFVTVAGGPIDTGQGVWPSNTVDFGSPTASPNLVPAKHDGSANQVDDYMGFVQFATSTANSPSFGRKWQQSVWDGATHREETWGMGPLIPASGTPTQDFFHYTAPGNEIVASPSSVGWIWDSIFPATISSNFSSGVLGLRGSYWPSGGPATSIGWNWQALIGSGVTPTNDLFFSPTVCPTGNCSLGASVLKSTVITGTPPLIINSTTPVTNLTLASAAQVVNALDLSNTGTQTMQGNLLFASGKSLNTGIIRDTGGTAAATLSAGKFTFPNLITVPAIATAANCSSSAAPAVCGSAASGSVVIAASGTAVTVNTTAVTANSQIYLQEDESLGTKLGVTCNTGILANPPAITARTAGTSFAIGITTGLTVNPVCFSYTIVN